MLSVQVFGPGGTRSEYRSRIFWIDGRRTRAAAEAPQRKRPCRSRATPCSRRKASNSRFWLGKPPGGSSSSTRCGKSRSFIADLALAAAHAHRSSDRRRGGLLVRDSLRRARPWQKPLKYDTWSRPISHWGVLTVRITYFPTV